MNSRKRAKTTEPPGCTEGARWFLAASENLQAHVPDMPECAIAEGRPSDTVPLPRMRPFLSTPGATGDPHPIQGSFERDIMVETCGGNAWTVNP